jgi:hypothetical protein
MSLFICARAIPVNERIQIFNHGRMARSFTYIDDIEESCVSLTRTRGGSFYSGINDLGSAIVQLETSRREG